VQRTEVTIVLKVLLALIGLTGGIICLAVTVFFCKVTCCANYNCTNNVSLRLSLERGTVCTLYTVCRLSVASAVSIKQVDIALETNFSVTTSKSRFSVQCSTRF